MMVYEELMEQLREGAGSGYKRKLLGDAYIALSAANRRIESNARIIDALHVQLNEAWKENEALRRELKKVKPELEGYA